MVDAASGIQRQTRHLPTCFLKRRAIWLVANKIDGQNADNALSDFYGLGFGEPQAIAASMAVALACLVTITWSFGAGC